jgi:hypothetical protein
MSEFTTVFSASGTAVYQPAGTFLPTSNIGSARATFEIAGISSSDLQIAPGFQVADVRTTVAGVGTFMSSGSLYEDTNDLYFPTQWVTAEQVNPEVSIHEGALVHARLAWCVPWL